MLPKSHIATPYVFLGLDEEARVQTKVFTQIGGDKAKFLSSSWNSALEAYTASVRKREEWSEANWKSTLHRLVGETRVMLAENYDIPPAQYRDRRDSIHSVSRLLFIKSEWGRDGEAQEAVIRYTLPDQGSIHGTAEAVAAEMKISNRPLDYRSVRASQAIIGAVQAILTHLLIPLDTSGSVD